MHGESDSEDRELTEFTDIENFFHIFFPICLIFSVKHVTIPYLSLISS
jgi:hypothetical protein